MSLFSLIPELTQKEDVDQVIQELTGHCSNCRLSLLHNPNRGLVWRGNPHAKMAFIGEAPGDKESESGVPFVGPAGKEFERWMRLLRVDTRTEAWVANVVMCQPEKVERMGRMTQRAPNRDEITACFEPRCLRVLKAMPNLEVIVTLGWTAASTILGVEATTKTHEGQWFLSYKVPNVLVFPMVHPAYLLYEPSSEKKGKVETILKLFQREYLKSPKILTILKENQQRHGAEEAAL